ncbi:hypothetical protein NE237_013674 [Protea cynaroides]|uniref:GDSL esterase/lipase n=1 Tax=Protea cynaroides TaxID=273540 RepID=A0A9Q0H1F3_9MAGN|nr:hypothetical protein NE237_013674 [Protea cynaroides]
MFHHFLKKKGLSFNQRIPIDDAGSSGLYIHSEAPGLRVEPEYRIVVLNCWMGGNILTIYRRKGSEEQVCKGKAVIFNFGDSNSDTGSLAAGLGYNISLPNGRTFFRRPTGRLSDGRLVLDFLCENLTTSLLSPYLDSVGSDFANGVNFAFVGSSTLPKSVPFALNVQVKQFLHFKSRSLQITSPHKGCLRRLVDGEGFLNALYMIDIGQNDLSHAFAKNLSYDQVVQTIPSIQAQIKSAVKTIYEQGGKNFWIHNTGPLGCLPQKLSLFRRTTEDFDQHGCIRSYNDVAQSFNRDLRVLCEEMRSEMANATIVYVDIYSIKYDLIANSTKYGFQNPLMACCGYGGPPYNYHIHLTCGHSGCMVCNEGTRSTCNLARAQHWSSLALVRTDVASCWNLCCHNKIRCKQGAEMLSIFKSYTSKTPIDFFLFYEERQKIMYEEKARLLSKAYEVGSMPVNVSGSLPEILMVGTIPVNPKTPKVDKERILASDVSDLEKNQPFAKWSLEIIPNELLLLIVAVILTRENSAFSSASPKNEPSCKSYGYGSVEIELDAATQMLPFSILPFQIAKQREETRFFSAKLKVRKKKGGERKLAIKSHEEEQRRDSGRFSATQIAKAWED